MALKHSGWASTHTWPSCTQCSLRLVGTNTPRPPSLFTIHPTMGGRQAHGTCSHEAWASGCWGWGCSNCCLRPSTTAHPHLGSGPQEQVDSLVSPKVRVRLESRGPVHLLSAHPPGPWNLQACSILC